MSLSNEGKNMLKLIIEKENRFTQPWKNSDVVLVVEDKELHVHSITLSMVSPVFEAMFNGNFKEAQTKRVVLEGKPYDTFLYMLRMVYPFEDVFLEDEILYCEGCSTVKKGQRKDFTKEPPRFGYYHGCSAEFKEKETAELIESEDLKTACLDYIKRDLYSLSNVDKLLEGRSFTLKTEMKIK
ncbi:uncharacterized protein [Clytia hemisphaerica]|uniref:uncharacterized protein isoform X2 n=1 Tax=Clytia hemisphaerica TaxID=252671 RepID=UPI0034D5CA4B